MITRRLTVLTVAVAATGALAVGAFALGQRDSGQPSGSATGTEPIRLGMLVPLSGSEQASAAHLVRGAQMAVDEANAEGGVNGQKVELITEDAGCDAETAVLGAQRLLAQDITAHVGGYCSSGTLPALPSLHDADVLTVTPASNSDELLKPRFDDLFLMMPTGSQEARFAVDLIHEQGARNPAFIHDGSSYSANIATVAAAAAVEPVATPAFETVNTLVLTSGEESYAVLAADVVALDTDLVYFTGYYPEASKLIRDMRAAGFDGRFMIADGCFDPQYVEKAGAEAEGTIVTMGYVPDFDPAGQAWAQRFRDHVGHDPGPYSSQSYDAVNVVLDAIRDSGSTDGDVLAKAIHAASFDFTDGPGSFVENGSRAASPLMPLVVTDGKYVLRP